MIITLLQRTNASPHSPAITNVTEEIGVDINEEEFVRIHNEPCFILETRKES